MDELRAVWKLRKHIQFSSEFGKSKGETLYVSAVPLNGPGYFRWYRNDEQIVLHDDLHFLTTIHSLGTLALPENKTPYFHTLARRTMIIFRLEGGMRSLSRSAIFLRVKLFEKQCLVGTELRSVVPPVVVVREDLSGLKTFALWVRATECGVFLLREE